VSGLMESSFRIDSGNWIVLSDDNFDAHLRGKDEALVELKAIDNLGNIINLSYIISHYALFSVPGAVIAQDGEVMLNSNCFTNSFNSVTGEQDLGNGHVISSAHITVNSTPSIKGTMYDYTTVPIEVFPVPGEAQTIDTFIVNSNETATLEHGIYYIKNLILNSNSTLIIQGGYVKIWFDTCTIDGTIIVDKTKHLWMVGTEYCEYLNINSSTQFTGIIYAHNRRINANWPVTGSIIGKTITLNSEAYINYDEDTRIHDRWFTLGN
ncbi:MAG: hypothetical protein OQK82_06675, partial [Candidatus Pacearchaeota archaeon]|nr:hypothetical protein [Candidatus Pacearchaeota archaeon]